jgi:hypothetical protein
VACDADGAAGPAAPERAGCWDSHQRLGLGVGAPVRAMDVAALAMAVARDSTTLCWAPTEADQEVVVSMRMNNRLAKH